MIAAAIINGVSVPDCTRALDIEDRGLQYGHGLFETAALERGQVRFLEDHLARLEDGCARLAIPFPSRAVLLAELAELIRGHERGVVKCIVTRGRGGRGYRPPPSMQATRILALYGPVQDPAPAQAGIAVRWCATRLARQPQLAGLKHLNRLEQVIAQAEWDDPLIAEGLMLDTQGELVGGTSSNVFVVVDQTLLTPDLRYSGVHGIMRGRVIQAALANGIAVERTPLWPHELATASEVFVTNAVRGIRPVVRLGDKEWPVGTITGRLARLLELW